MRVRDLLPEREALLSRDYWTKRNQIVGLANNVTNILRQQEFTGTRLSVDDLNQRPGQGTRADATVAETLTRLQIESEAGRFIDPIPAAVTGQLTRLADSVRSDPGKLEEARAEALRLINQIRPPQKEVNWDYAVIERINRNDLSTLLVPFNLGKAVLENDPVNNVLLQPGDVITIFSKDDVRTPIAQQTKYIRLEGEFNSAGIYQIMPGETLRQLVTRVGGVARQAYLFGAEFTRESTKIQQQKNLDDALNRLERDIQRFAITRAQNVSNVEDASALKQQADSQQALIARLRQVRPTGRIVLGFSEDASLNDVPDLTLENGDRFFIPSPPSMINVFGAVYNENSFIYRPENRVSDYLEQAGGPTKDADSRSIYVLRADGTVVSARQSGFLAGLFAGSLEGKRLMPGDSVVVPEELDKTSLMRNLKDITQVLYQFGLGAAALKVLKD
jgi:protein involved in polysaccharide export with SLBB domain